MSPLQHRPVTLALLLGVTLSSTGCVPDFATDFSELRQPRLLAIASDPAETQGKKELTLTALVALPEGSAAPRVDWTLCLSRKPLTELGPVNPICFEPDAGDGAVQRLGSGNSVKATLDQDVCKLFGPLRPSPMAGEPAGRPVDPDATGGFYQPIVASLEGEPSLGSVRIDCDPANLNRDDALSYRQQYRVNENPRISALSQSVDGGPSSELADGAASVSVRAGASVELRARWDECPTTSSCGDGLCTANEDDANCAEDCETGAARGCTGAERYVWFNPAAQRIEPRREGISVAWYTSSGHFDDEQTGVDEAQAASTTHTGNTWRVGEASGPATVWAVVRDSRGGVSWRTFSFSVDR